MFTGALYYIKNYAGKYLPHVIRASEPKGIQKGQRSDLMCSQREPVLNITKWRQSQEYPKEQWSTS